VECFFKTGVDPKPKRRIEGSCDEFYQLTSDEYFATVDFGYDIIFVDGLHHSEQVIKDIENALTRLYDGGTIVVHDCRPLSKVAQEYPMPQTTTWNGDVWRAWLDFRTRDDFSMFVVNEDHGCGIIQRGKQHNKLKLDHESISYDQFSENIESWLNLIEFKDIDKWLK